MNRRSFMKVGALSAGLPAAAQSEGKISMTPNHRVASDQARQRELPPIPESKDLASHKLVYGYSEIFSPPPAQNEWGYCQATRSVSGITTILFPPFACCGAPSIPTPGGEISPGALITCDLFWTGGCSPPTHSPNPELPTRGIPIALSVRPKRREFTLRHTCSCRRSSRWPLKS